jgi:hypothetical protein
VHEQEEPNEIVSHAEVQVVWEARQANSRHVGLDDSKEAGCRLHGSYGDEEPSEEVFSQAGLVPLIPSANLRDVGGEFGP